MEQTRKPRAVPNANATLLPAPSLTLSLAGSCGDAPHRYGASWDDDIGSTLYFDRAKLKRVADAQDRELSELTMRQSEEQPLACVTSKRLRLR